jgi:mRNA-degrading endonuclease RelE of RelBE toxin-antitoxin system
MKAVFIETTLFEKIRPDYLDEDTYRKFQLSLMVTPKAGDVIQGTGGIRKVRWSAKGKGKRSGVRIIYYWLDEKDRFYLLTLYAKNEVKDLMPDEKKILKKIVEDWKNEQTKSI